MPRYLVSSYLPDNFDPSTVTEEVGAAIHALNDEMEAAGVLKFACGISHPSSARTLRSQPGGKLLVTDGPYMETKEHIGGLYLLDAANMDEVVAWMKKGSAGVLGAVEIREIFFHADPTKPEQL